MLNLRFKVNSIYLDKSIHFVDDSNQLENDKESTSFEFYNDRKDKNPFRRGNNRSINQSRIGKHPTHEEVESRCYAPIMIHSYLTKSFNKNNEGTVKNSILEKGEEVLEVSNEKELVIHSNYLTESSLIPSYLRGFQKYDIRGEYSSCSSVSTSNTVQLINKNEITLTINSDENEVPIDITNGNYNLILQLYLTMLSEYSVSCGVDFGKITINLFDLYYLLTLMTQKKKRLNQDFSFKSLNNLILTSDGELLLFLDIFPLITPSSVYSKQSSITNSDEKNQNIFFRGDGVDKLSKEHSKVVLSITVLDFGIKLINKSPISINSALLKGIKNEEEEENNEKYSFSNMNKMFLISKLFFFKEDNVQIGSHYKSNNQIMNSIEEVGFKWNNFSEEEKERIRRFMLKYKSLSYKFDETNMEIYMKNSNNILCITTPSQNTYYNTNIAMPIFSYTLKKPQEIKLLTNEQYWIKTTYYYAKHYLIESRQWINNEVVTVPPGTRTNNKKSNYKQLQDLEKGLPNTREKLEKWILDEFYTLFEKSSIDQRISHTFNIVMFHVHVCLEYMSDYTISEDGFKSYIEIFGDANKLGSGDCEDLTGAGLELFMSFMKKKFLSKKLQYMQVLLKGYVPLVLIEGSESKKLDDSDDSKEGNDVEGNRGRGKREMSRQQKPIPPEIRAGHASLKLIPIPYFMDMIKNWNPNKNYPVNKILTNEWNNFQKIVRELEDNLEFYNWLNKNQLPILIGEGTAMLESGTLLDEQTNSRTMVNCCPGVEKFRKKFFLPDKDRLHSPFYVALFLGITNYFIERGFNQGFFYFAFKNPENYFSFERSEEKGSDDSFGKGVLFMDFMMRSSGTTLIPNLSSQDSNVNEIEFINKEEETKIMETIKQVIVNRSPLPKFYGDDVESNNLNFKLKEEYLSFLNVIYNDSLSSNSIYAVVSHYVFQEYIDDILFSNIIDYFSDWNSIVFGRLENFDINPTIKMNIKNSKLFLMDIYIHLEHDSNKKPSLETSLNPLKDVYRFDFIIGKVK